MICEIVSHGILFSEMILCLPFRLLGHDCRATTKIGCPSIIWASQDAALVPRGAEWEFLHPNPRRCSVTFIGQIHNAVKPGCNFSGIVLRLKYIHISRCLLSGEPPDSRVGRCCSRAAILGLAWYFFNDISQVPQADILNRDRRESDRLICMIVIS